jgi:predicted acyltransferase
MPAEAPAPSHRIVSVDVLRGITVMLMIAANAAVKNKENAPRWILHSDWQGLTLADVVFPAFITLVGISIPLALHRSKREGGFDRRQARHIAWRTFRIIVLGVLLTNLDWFSDPENNPFRPWGVLQRIGLVYGVSAVLFLCCRARSLAIVAAAMLVLYWPLTLLPPLDGLANDLWARGHNFAASIDRTMLGAGRHLLVEGTAGYDPEGLLGTLPAIAQGLIGVIAGECLIRQPGRRVTRQLTWAAAGLLALGLVWSFGFPIVKDIWSSSFVLVTTGLTILALAGLHRWLDHQPSATGFSARALAVPVAFGINAIAAYVLDEIGEPILEWPLMLKAMDWSETYLGTLTATLVPPLVFLLLIWVCMDYLQRRRWIVKI